ncbi:sulfite exporter TauE/SafE family protein [Piscinibacter sp.]|uniref:sulfite exporter TauE/SafE family protein n=1 Tax=Piscinibacter sp. TaxID=1903157 RepID=UPI002CBFC82F|nr:sulfite exporter TauE/SafE family protein [Albitalea sp.]HUG21034.1 sulfite exporter TauE/SafE family protein [Albitalea sp.]
MTLGDSPWQLALACFVALAASTLGGLSGFGTGLVLPVFLVPLVGVANVIPVMAVAMILNNGSRVIAFWREVQWAHVGRMLALGLPACAAGAYSYTLLSSKWISVLLGTFLLVSVPLRRLLRRAQLTFSPAAEFGAGAFFGFINGGMTGTGVILISILMSVGVAGSALVATDAVVSVVMGLAKVALFGNLAALNLELGLVGLLVGLFTAPGAFFARALLKHMPAGIHAWFMEAVVIAGAVALLWHAKG